MSDGSEILLWFVDTKSGDYVKKTKFVLHLQWPRRGTKEAHIVTSDKLKITVLSLLLNDPYFLAASLGHIVDVQKYSLVSRTEISVWHLLDLFQWYYQYYQ